MSAHLVDHFNHRTTYKCDGCGRLFVWTAASLQFGTADECELTFCSHDCAKSNRQRLKLPAVVVLDGGR